MCMQELYVNEPGLTLDKLNARVIVDSIHEVSSVNFERPPKLSFCLLKNKYLLLSLSEKMSVKQELCNDVSIFELLTFSPYVLLY